MSDKTGGAAEDIQCPVCGYYCLGRGGHGCIDKPFMVKREAELSEANRKLAQAEETADHFNGKANDFYAELLKARNQLAFIQA